jgi:hypothetical protein
VRGENGVEEDKRGRKRIKRFPKKGVKKKKSW